MMNSLNKKIRFLPVIGIALTLAGYLFLVYQTYNLNERKNVLKHEIEDLETIKARLTVDSKKKDTIISMQDTIISQSSDKETVERGIELKKELNTPASNHFTVSPTGKGNPDDAKKYEADGFNYLLQKDINNAIASFTRSENSVNGYHMVYDIASYLKKNKAALTDKESESWKEAYRKLLKDYSWKMPADVKQKLAELSGSGAN